MWEFLHPPSPSQVPHMANPPPPLQKRTRMRQASDLVAMAFGRNKPKSDCFDYYTLDNHADICIFCNAGLLANIRPSEFRVNGIGNSNIQFDQVGDHLYCGTVIYAPNNRYNQSDSNARNQRQWTQIYHGQRQYIRRNNGQGQLHAGTIRL